MKIAILGTGQVGQAIGARLLQLGPDVRLGSRDPGTKAHLSLPVVPYDEAARQAEWIVNALPGEAALAILRACETDGKILIVTVAIEAILSPLTLIRAFQPAFKAAANMTIRAIPGAMNP